MTEKIVPAHGSSVARADIPADCKWRVSDIYVDETAWKEACDELKAKLPVLSEFKGLLGDAKVMAAALIMQDELAQMVEKIYAYARLQQDADNTDQHMQALSGEAET